MPSAAPRPPPWLRSHRWRQWHRLLRRHRRGLTAGLAGLSLLCSLEAAAPEGPVTVDVVVAGRDLAGGGPLSAADLRLARLPQSAVPGGALRLTSEAVGRTLAAPVRRGEPLTDVRLLGSRLVDALRPGLVATPVRLADPSVVGLLRPGDRVDVLAAPADPAQGTATTLAAADVPVLAVPAVDPTGDQGALVVLATTSRVAMALAGAASGQRLSVTLRGS